MKEDKQTLTSVKVDKTLFDEFKIKCFTSRFNFQKLCDRSLYLYLHDEEFKKRMHNMITLNVSGSI